MRPRALALLLVAIVLGACTVLSEESASEPVAEPTPPATIDPEELRAVAEECLNVGATTVGLDFDGGGYCLGPDFADADDLESVSSELSDIGQWDTLPVFTTEGIDRYNVVAAECFERTPTCPTGRVAVVSAGRVFTAPTIQTPVFERDQIVISGSTEGDGRWLVKRIEASDNSGALRFHTVLQEVVS